MVHGLGLRDYSCKVVVLMTSPDGQRTRRQFKIRGAGKKTKGHMFQSLKGNLYPITVDGALKSNKRLIRQKQQAQVILRHVGGRDKS